MVLFVISVILLAGYCDGSSTDDHDYVTRDITTLLLTFVVHRHGDRTPVADSYCMSEHVEEIIEKTKPLRPGSLTNEGKMRGYYIGQFLRWRYSSLLPEIFSEKDVYIRSTDIERAKMTILAGLSAMYPPQRGDMWKEDLMWQPIPYTTESTKYDYMTYVYNCKNTNFEELLTRPEPRMFKYVRLLHVLTQHTGINFFQEPLRTYLYYDLIVSEMAIGIPMSDWLKPYWKELSEAGESALLFIYEPDHVRRLTGGVFLNEFFTVANAIIAGNEVGQRVRIYSAHDLNVAAELSVARVPFLYPKYGSVFALELHVVNRTGEYFVVPVFLQKAGDSTMQVLPVDKCGDVCNYDMFYNLTSMYALTYEQYVTECKED